MSTVSTSSDSTASQHPYAGLESADTNYASWFDVRDLDDDDDFESDSDWRKTHKRTYFQHLDHQNRGYGNGGTRRNKKFETYQANVHLSQIYSNVLGLTIQQKKEAKLWFRRLDFESFGVAIRIPAYCICAYLVHSNDDDVRECHPQTPRDKWPIEFRSEIDTWPTKESRLIDSVYNKVAYRVRNWTVGVDEPASTRMDKYDMYESKLHHRKEPSRFGERGGI